jgi:hypothetical protein
MEYPPRPSSGALVPARASKASHVTTQLHGSGRFVYSIETVGASYRNAVGLSPQWVYRGSGSIVAVGLSWQWVYRGSGSIVIANLSR